MSNYLTTNYLSNSLFDTGFIVGNEGSRLFPYYPGIPFAKQNNVVSVYGTYSNYSSNYSNFESSAGNSGVTIAIGFDLGQKNSSYLSTMSNRTQANLLATAIGLTKNNALDWIWNNQQSFGVLTQNDSNAIMNNYFGQNYQLVLGEVPNFNTFQFAFRTAIMDMGMSGVNSGYFQGAIGYFNDQNITGLISYLQAQTNRVLIARAKRIISLLQGINTNYNNSSYDSTMKVASAKTDSSSALAIAIGNELVLSNYTSSDSTNSYFTRIFTNSGFDQTIIPTLLGAMGLDDEDVTNYISKNQSFSLSNEQCDNLLTNILYENRIRIQSIFGVDLPNNPREVNTALMSYVFDKNLDDADTLKDEVNPIIPLLKNRKYNDLATFIEKDGVDDLDRFTTRRTQEANLIRNRTSDQPNYPTGQTDDTNDPDAFFANKQSQLDSDVATTRAQLSALENTTNVDYSGTDDIYTEVTPEVSSNFSDLLQQHQIMTDNYYNDTEGDYEIRLGIKTLFNQQTRSQQISYYQVEQEIENSGGASQLLESAYEYIPYGTNLFQDIKANAVARCQYRIKSLKNQLTNIQSSVSSYGIFDMTLSDKDLLELALVSPEISVVLLILQTLFKNYQTTNNILSNEQQNLVYLIKEANRFTKTNSST